MITIDAFEADEAVEMCQAVDCPAPLRSILTRVARCFRITSDLAPGLSMIGGEIALTSDEATAHEAPRLSATGTGPTLAEALTSFLGEAAELLSQFERPGDVASRFAPAGERPVGETTFAAGWIDALLAALRPDEPIDWVHGRAEPDAGLVLLPADLCLRRAPPRRRLQLVAPISSGCAAGPAIETARLRALLELVERDAAALWWHGGLPPRAIAPDCAAGVAGSRLLAALRQDRSSRRTTLLDITTDLGIPVVAAVSVGRDGRGLACGLAARPDPAAATIAAIRELAQMELSAPLASMKCEARGEAALNAADRRHLARAAVDTTGWSCLQAMSRATGEGVAHGLGVEATAEDLAAVLAGKGIRLAHVDLTRSDLAIPVARAVSPDLQPFTASVATARLASCAAAYPRPDANNLGVPLM